MNETLAKPLQVGDELCLGQREYYGVVLDVDPLKIRFRQGGPGGYHMDATFAERPTRQEALEVARSLDPNKTVSDTGRRRAEEDAEIDAIEAGDIAEDRHLRSLEGE